MANGILSGFLVIVWSIICNLDLVQLAQQIKQWGTELGFQQVGSPIPTSAPVGKLQAWLDKQYHGGNGWMARHGMMRPSHELLPGTLRVISVRMNYLPANAAFARTLKNPTLGYVSHRYALGRDYHKLLRNRLKKLGRRFRNGVLRSILDLLSIPRLSRKGQSRKSGP